jgi:hypothetical protein
MPPTLNLAFQDAFCPDSAHRQQPSQGIAATSPSARPRFRLVPLRPRALRNPSDAALASTPEHRDGPGGSL